VQQGKGLAFLTQLI